MPPKNRLARRAAPFVHTADEKYVHRFDFAPTCAGKISHRPQTKVKPAQHCIAVSGVIINYTADHSDYERDTICSCILGAEMG